MAIRITVQMAGCIEELTDEEIKEVIFMNLGDYQSVKIDRSKPCKKKVEHVEIEKERGLL